MTRKICFKAAVLFWAAVFFIFPLRLVDGKGEHPREKLGAYTTYFSEKDGGRCRNIALAAERIDGVALQPYGELSFNALVGKRTRENGFFEAKIIAGGEFVVGVGGGVCQVSTTLYNAALLSGLAVVEVHPHSLAVGYAPPSRDAMVSSESDLKLFNPFDETVYFSVKTGNGAITVTVRGEKTGRSYDIESRTVAYIPPPPPEEVTDGKLIREGRDGVKSEAYLERYQGDKLVERKRLRTDEYRPIQGIIVKKVGEPTIKIASNDCLFS